MRRDVQDAEILSFPEETDRPVLFSTMKPWPDVSVKTWLVPPTDEDDAPNWHLRVHRIDTGRDLMSAEGGFAILGTNSKNGRFLTALSSEDGGQAEQGTIEDPSSAAVVSRAGASGVRDLSGANAESGRKGGVCFADANSNLIEARTLLPCLYGDLKAGSTTWFVSGVFALPAGVESDGWKAEWRKQWEEGIKLPGWVGEMVGSEG